MSTGKSSGIKDRGTTLRGLRIPGQNMMTVFLPYGKIRHVEGVNDRDLIIDDEYLVHFPDKNKRNEFVDAIDHMIMEYHIDDKPAITTKLDHVSTEMFRASKEISDHLQRTVDLLHTAVEMISNSNTMMTTERPPPPQSGPKKTTTTATKTTGKSKPNNAK